MQPVNLQNRAVVGRSAAIGSTWKDLSITMPRLGLRLTPHGHLLLDAAEDAAILDNAVAERLAEAFGRSTGHGLVQLGAGEDH